MKKSKPLKTQAFRKLAALYQRMDKAYVQAAEAMGLSCTGCTDNCCRTHFQHHTYIEWAYLWKAISSAPAARQQQLVDRAMDVVEQSRTILAAGKRPKIMCPLNEQGLCAVYENRLMICRLHGVPNRFVLPNGSAREFPGCFKAQELSQGADRPALLDRTTFYRELAGLEQAFLGNRKTSLPRVDMTLSEMLVLGPPPV